MPRADRPPTPAEWADRVRAVRARLGLTQEQLARRMSVTARTVQAWEGGSRVPLPAVRRLFGTIAQQKAPQRPRPIRGRVRVPPE